MKKMLMLVVAGCFYSASSGVSAGMSYECWTYVNGHPDKMTHVVADNRQQAEVLAVAKFRDLGAKSDYIKCH